MVNEIYLDNAATTRCDQDVAEKMLEIMTRDYGNPSSAHRKGMEAEKYVRESGEMIAKTLHCTRSEILFTSGGTESDNLALIGGAYAGKRRGTRIITSCFEHPAVLHTLQRLSGEGFDIVYLPVTQNGQIETEALYDALTEETILVSIMAVNNEIGTAQPLLTIGKMIREKAPKALFHTDAVQGYGKIPLDVRAAKIDLLSVSAHKIHGPKGAGFLYVRDGVRLIPQITGGGQQKDLRSGTENVPGIAGLGLAAMKAFENFAADHAQMAELRDYFCEQVLSKLDDVYVNGISELSQTSLKMDTAEPFTDKSDKQDDTSADQSIYKSDSESQSNQFSCAPHIISFSVRGVRAEVLLHALEDKGIYVSSGSACSTNHPAVSKTLYAIGLDQDLLDSTIRFSLSRYTTKEEIDYTLKALKEIIPALRRFRAF